MAEIRKRRGSKCIMHLGDFANMLKAFIGSNYLGVAYAFSKSGVVLGSIGLLFIATLTDHCCHLIVKAKYAAIKQVLEDYKQQKQQRLSGSSTPNRYQAGNRIDCNGFTFSGEVSSTTGTDSEEDKHAYGREVHPGVEVEVDDEDILKQHMMRHMSYGDVGRISYGRFGLMIVNIFIAATQFCFCVAYFIFIGNTIFGLFPEHLVCSDMTTVQTPFPVSSARTSTTFKTTTLSAVDIQNISSTFLHMMHRSKQQSNFTAENITSITPSILENGTTSMDIVTNSSDITTLPTTTIDIITNSSNITTPSTVVTTTVNSTVCKEESILDPNFLKIFVASPLPIFIVFALIRSIRHMSWISVIANVSILGGCVAVFFYLVVGFKVNTDNFHLFRFEGLALFFGIVTAGFEGIGLVIPVESSMEGNRHNFNAFLHGTVFFLALILGVFGVFGYMRFGHEVEQMINLNIDKASWIYYIVNIGVCVGVLLTFPLQIYPVIELIEIILFSEGSICGPRKTKGSLLEDMESEESNESKNILPTLTDSLPITVAVHIPESVAAWKRNIVRVIVVLIATGLAVLFRKSFAYVAGFNGALGSTFLAYILPCLFHLKLCRSNLPWFVKMKDVLIILFGLSASVISLRSVIQQLISNTDV